MQIRELEQGDIAQLLALYTQLHENPMPIMDARLRALWDQILQDKNHHIIGGFIDEHLICSCVLIIVPNLTNAQRPYALIENVITDQDHRKRGYATDVLAFAKGLAMHENCYKIMLMTGSKKEETLCFYERAGFNRADKTAFVQWL